MNYCKSDQLLSLHQASGQRDSEVLASAHGRCGISLDSSSSVWCVILNTRIVTKCLSGVAVSSCLVERLESFADVDKSHTVFTSK